MLGTVDGFPVCVSEEGVPGDVCRERCDFHSHWVGLLDEVVEDLLTYPTLVSKPREIYTYPMFNGKIYNEL